MRVISLAVVLSFLVSIPAAVADPPSPRDYEGLTSDEIFRLAGAELRVRRDSLLPLSGGRLETLSTTMNLAGLRGEIIQSLGEAYPLSELEGICMADAIDDTLAKYLGDLFAAYPSAHPEPILNSGTEKFGNLPAVEH